MGDEVVFLKGGIGVGSGEVLLEGSGGVLVGGTLVEGAPEGIFVVILDEISQGPGEHAAHARIPYRRVPGGESLLVFPGQLGKGGGSGTFPPVTVLEGDDRLVEFLDFLFEGSLEGIGEFPVAGFGHLDIGGGGVVEVYAVTSGKRLFLDVVEDFEAGFGFVGLCGCVIRSPESLEDMSVFVWFWGFGFHGGR